MSCLMLSKCWRCGTIIGYMGQVAKALENVQELIIYNEYLVALQNVLSELLTHHICIPADILSIIDVIDDSYIKRLQASLWGV